MKRTVKVLLTAAILLAMTANAWAVDPNKSKKWFSLVMQNLLGRPANAQEIAKWKPSYTSGKFKEKVYNWLRDSDEFNEHYARFYYKKYLKHEPSKEAKAFWGKRMKQKGAHNVITGLLIGKEYMKKRSASADAYASNLLQDAMGMQPSQKTIQNWAAQTNMKNPGVVVEKMLRTDEYKTTQIKLFYSWLFGREPRKAELRGWWDLWKKKGKDEDWVFKMLIFSKEFQEAAEK